MAKDHGSDQSEMFGTEYSITPDNLVKGVTYFVILMFLFLGFVVPPVVFIKVGEIFAALLVFIIIMGSMVPTIYLSWISSPSIYKISERGVTIQRPWKPLLIPIAEISKVEPKGISFSKTIKFGNGGLFSISGSFYNKADGWFKMYIKNRNLVMIHAAKKWVVSPDEKDLFITDLNGKLDKAKSGKGKKKPRSK